jgi:hypothetical protein
MAKGLRRRPSSECHLLFGQPLGTDEVMSSVLPNFLRLACQGKRMTADLSLLHSRGGVGCCARREVILINRHASTLHIDYISWVSINRLARPWQTALAPGLLPVQEEVVMRLNDGKWLDE